MSTHLPWCHGTDNSCVCGYAKGTALHEDYCQTWRKRDGVCDCSYAFTLAHAAEVRAQTEKETAEKIVTWMEGLAGHFATPNERRDWYRGVAMDIRHMGPWQADAEYRRNKDK